MMENKFVLMWEEEPVMVLSNRADAEEMWFSLWEEDFCYNLNRTINLLDVPIDYIIDNWDSYRRIANYGWWIGEVPYLN